MLAEDHENARILGERLRQIPGLLVEQVETNIVLFDVRELGRDAPGVQAALTDRGVRVSSNGRTRLRAVTHLDVTRAQVEAAGKIVAETLSA